MTAPLSDGGFTPRELSAMRGAMPRVLADVANFLGRRKPAAEPEPPYREIVLLFDSPAASYRAEELMKRLHHAGHGSNGKVASVVSIHLHEETRELEIADSHNAGAEALPLPQISTEMRGWFADWLAARHLEEGFALILPVCEADPDPHMMEEAKLSAAVCHGLLRLFDLTHIATPAQEAVAA
jgi:hypothetical protein